MELKKTKKANIERHRGMFFQIGMLIALGIVLAAFEWGVRTSNTTEKWVDKAVPLEPDIINSVTPEQPQKAPPPVNPTSFIMLPDDAANIDIPDIIITDTPPIDIFGKGTVDLPPDNTDDPIDIGICGFPPKFQNGDASKFQAWVMSQVAYPELAIQNQIEGKVFVKFVIDKKGNLTNIEIARGVDESLDSETIRVLKKSPKWEPGLQNGKPVSVRYFIPVTFKLQK